MKKAIVGLLASFVLGFCTPYVLAIIIAGDPSCTGCSSSLHPAAVTCNGGPCKGKTTQLDEASCNKCCTDGTTSSCSGKDGVTSAEHGEPRAT
jgi:hypothetical protein